MTIDEKIIRSYLQSAHEKGGSYHMAMSMMADRLLVLEDKLLRSGVDFPEDKVFKEFAEKSSEAQA